MQLEKHHNSAGGGGQHWSPWATWSPKKELPRVQMLIKTEQRMVTSWSEKRDASPLLSWQLPPLPVSDALGRGGPGDRWGKFELDGAAL